MNNYPNLNSVSQYSNLPIAELELKLSQEKEELDFWNNEVINANDPFDIVRFGAYVELSQNNVAALQILINAKRN